MTVTSPEMKRFFMTIPEAASLIIQAGAYGDPGATYLLDMGEEVAIVDLARRMIRLHGLRPGKDIEVVFTGLRPGEKLREELSLQTELAAPTAHPKIRLLTEPSRAAAALPALSMELDRLRDVARLGTTEEIRKLLFDTIAEADGGDLGREESSLHPPLAQVG